MLKSLSAIKSNSSSGAGPKMRVFFTRCRICRKHFGMEGMEDDQRRPRRMMSPLIVNEVSQTRAGNGTFVLGAARFAALVWRRLLAHNDPQRRKQACHRIQKFS